MTATHFRKIWLHGETQDSFTRIMREFFTPQDTLIGTSTPSLGQFPNGTLVPALYAALHGTLDLLLIENAVFERLPLTQRSNLTQIFADYGVVVKSYKSCDSSSS